MTPPTSPRRAIRAYTTVGGERVTKFDDGTERRVPATTVPTTTPTPTLPRTTPPSTDIPVAAIDGAVPGLVIPEVPQIADVVGPARTAGTQFLNQMRTQADAQMKETEARGTASDNKIRELLGFINTEAASRDRLEDIRGVTAIESQMRKAEQAIASQIAELDAFDLSSVTELEQMRQDASRRDITKRTFGAQAAEFNLQRTIERAGMAAGLRATLAGNLALQGNLQAATEQVDKALRAVYEPKRQELEMEKFFLQRNDVRLGQDRAEARELRLKGIDRQFTEIDRALVNVDAAVATGFASQEEIRQMATLADPQHQNQLAQSIIARASRAEIQRQKDATSASRSAAMWSQRAAAFELAQNGDPLAIEFLNFDPRESNMTLQDSFSYINETMEFDRILSNLDNAVKSDAAIDASTGIVRSSIGTASTRFGGPGLIAGGVAGSVVPGVGSAIGSFAGWLTGTAAGTIRVGNEKKDMLGSLSALSNTAAFTKMREYREQGISFGQLTEAERIAIGRSAADLFAALDIRPDGVVTGVNVSGRRFRELVASYRKETEVRKQQKAELYSGLTPADEQLINEM